MTIRACIRDMLQNAKGSVAELLIQIFLLQASKILESRQYTYIVRQLTSGSLEECITFRKYYSN